MYANLSGHYSVNDHVEVFGVVDNMMDRLSPEYVAIGVANGKRNMNYDVLGRAWKFGVRLKY